MAISSGAPFPWAGRVGLLRPEPTLCAWGVGGGRVGPLQLAVRLQVYRAQDGRCSTQVVISQAVKAEVSPRLGTGPAGGSQLQLASTEA